MKFWNKAAKERIRADGESQEDPHRHSARAEHLHLRAAVQWIPREPGRAAGKHHLFRLHQFGAVSSGREPRRDRSLLPGQDRHLARLQPDPGKASQEAAERHLLPDVRRADFAAGEDCRGECLPHRDGDAGDREGGIHQGKRRLRRAQRQVHRSGAEFRRSQTVRPPDAAGVAADSRLVAGRERSRR